MAVAVERTSASIPVVPDRRTILARQLEQDVLKTVDEMNAEGNVGVVLRRTSHMNVAGESSLLVLFDLTVDVDNVTRVKAVKVIPHADNRIDIVYTLGQEWLATQDGPMGGHTRERIRDVKRLAGFTDAFSFYDNINDVKVSFPVTEIVTAGFFEPVST